ncbi:MAG: hypothetical protein JOY83_00825 [Alphaproteobacteria bacterium]|nr:hypothetical protein [Alphaproteobacteria bacterium]
MRRYLHSTFATLLGLALANCAQSPQQQVSVGATKGVGTVNWPSEDTPSRFVGLISMKAQHAPPFLGVPETNFYCLRSFVDRQTGETRHQLYVSDSYSGAERRWSAARDETGHALRFVEISRNQITCDVGCSYAEEFAADIPENELRANPQGLKVTFTDSSGAEKTIIISGSQIAAQLAAIDGRQSLTSPPASPHQ